ncbi:hypothetical protein F2Q70_00017819 [Brassica cretica]|uniref:Uncharacterized protein n=1 Tax=Brassica cretica TaxID=69181 RepID=A0A8S9I5E4_BRACR|nr:hypothetical protein F2Q70_00017819 [Brassica cretica]
MAIGLYRPALSRPAAVHGQCGSWRYRPARDAVPRSSAQSRPRLAQALAVQARGTPIFINTCASDGNWDVPTRHSHPAISLLSIAPSRRRDQ